ncbi:MAG: GTP-binding protein [Promethearchaeota archaeon]
MDGEKRVLNVLIAGHAQAGKSSLIEAIVGIFPDYLSFEITRGTTITLKVIQFQLPAKNILLNFLDSPGHADFKGGIALGLEFADLLILVVSGKEGFQARTYWLFEKAIEKRIPIIIAATKMDLPQASIEKIASHIKTVSLKPISIVPTSAKNKMGMEDLVKKITLYMKKRDKIDLDPSFIILGFKYQKGLGVLINAGLLSGKIKRGWLTTEIKVRQIFSMNNSPILEAKEGDIVYLLLNIEKKFPLGTIYKNGKFIPPLVKSLLSEIKPRKEFYIKIKEPEKQAIAIKILEQLKSLIPSFDFYDDKDSINIMVLGDLQFDFIREQLENLIEFKIIGSKIKGIITINQASTGRYGSAHVRIIPRCKKLLTISRLSSKSNKLQDILGATAAFEAFHLDGLHVDIFSGKNEEDIAQAIVKAIEKVKIIKIVPYQDVLVKVENFNELSSLIEKYEIEILHQTPTNSFFLQVKNEFFEDFFNALMKISKGKAELRLFKFDQNDMILSVDPGTRHLGFSLIEKNELPSLWKVNFKHEIDNVKTQKAAAIKLKKELDLFLDAQKDFITKIFIGNGPGSQFLVNFFKEYFNLSQEKPEIPSINEKEGIPPLKEKLPESKHFLLSFKPPQIYLVDEYKTTKEAMYHLQGGLACT